LKTLASKYSHPDDVPKTTRYLRLDKVRKAYGSRAPAAPFCRKQFTNEEKQCSAPE
jgi:hypothetical protein